MRLVWGFPGWGWRMYGLVSLTKGKMWFIGFTKQIPTHFEDANDVVTEL